MLICINVAAHITYIIYICIYICIYTRVYAWGEQKCIQGFDGET